MAKKEERRFPLPSDKGHDFVDDDAILNFRPTIAFVQPKHEFGDEDPVEEEPVEEDTLESVRERVEDLKKGYDALMKLADQAEQRIDERVEAAGGLDIQLDASKDAHVVAAMKRLFPDRADPTIIAYDDYKTCLKATKEHAIQPEVITSEKLRAAKANQLKTDFGGLNKKPGLNRPEVGSGSSMITPLDLVAFQANAVISLFGMLKSLITDLIKSVVGL